MAGLFEDRVRTVRSSGTASARRPAWAYHATEWQLGHYAHVLARKRVLLVAATRDAIVPLGEVYEPLGPALRREGAQQLTAETLDSDHAFSNRRVRLARLLLRWLRSEQ